MILLKCLKEGCNMSLKIEKLDYEARGIAHQDGKICFIKNALPEEIVTMKITADKKSFSEGKTTSIIKKSPLRKEAVCPYANQCGGCVFSCVSYEDSLNLKKEILKDLLAYNKIQIAKVNLIPSSKSLGYRNKIALKIKDEQFGYYAEETHDFIPIKNCVIAARSIQNLLQDFHLLHLKNGSLTIRSNYNDELLLIIDSDEKPKIDRLLVEKHKIAGIIWNQKCVYNSPFFIEKMEQNLYKVHADSFFQINREIASKIASDITKYFNEEDIVYDLYCGVGYFSVKLASKVKQVIGIESNTKAILDATYNASLNGVSNCSFHAGKVEEIIAKIPFHGNKAIIDPPRSGLKKNVVKYLQEHPLKQIIYISCNPQTLVRDILELQKIYTISSLDIYDMFPFTKHMECVCVLNSKKGEI